VRLAAGHGTKRAADGTVTCEPWRRGSRSADPARKLLQRLIPVWFVRTAVFLLLWGLGGPVWYLGDGKYISKYIYR
jgi:hypothetical protein